MKPIDSEQEKQKIKSLAEHLRDYWHDLINLDSEIDTDAAAEAIRQNVHFRGANVFILFFAIVIASVGLNVNSIPVIIGAMLISPLMGPIIGFGLGLGTNDTDLILSALRNLAIMVTISILASTLYFLVSPLDMANPTELLARTKPTIYDVFIALFGGFAGMFETSRKSRGTVMSGVAISTALMPPLCTVGFGLASGNWAYAGGAIYLFLLNSVLIALATYLTAKYLGYKKVNAGLGWTRSRVISTALLVVVLIVPSIISAVTVVRENNFSRDASHFVQNHRVIGRSYVYNVAIDPSAPRIDLYLAGEPLDEVEKTAFYAAAAEKGFAEDHIVLHQSLTDERSNLMEETLVKDLFASKEEQIAAYQQQISELERQLRQLESERAAEVLPTQQLMREVRVSYPAISSLSLARGEVCVADSVQSTMIVVATTSSRLSASDRDQLSAWLSVRLDREVELIVR